MRRRAIALLLAGLPFVGGCLNFAHPLSQPCHEVWRPADDLPTESKNCVYVFIFNGLDPLEYSNMSGVRDHLHDLGFGKTYYGQDLHLSYFAEKLRYIHERCPSARFAIIGYDSGAVAAQSLAREGAKAGIPIDLLAYLEPDGVTPHYGENLAGNTITIWGESSQFCPKPVLGNDVYRLVSVGKSAIPSHPQTLGILERELTIIGMAAPVLPRLNEPRVPLVDPFPPPRSTKPNPKSLPPAWNFVRPYESWANAVPVPVAVPEILPQPRVVPELPSPKPKP